ncbi:MAG TPA: hypothetical protein DCZ95_03990 [Verrucomicrobia bacterium]|nr:hypothetical protein [Verrucomicrobiota bacterium]
MWFPNSLSSHLRLNYFAAFVRLGFAIFALELFVAFFGLGPLPMSAIGLFDGRDGGLGASSRPPRI